MPSATTPTGRRESELRGCCRGSGLPRETQASSRCPRAKCCHTMDNIISMSSSLDLSEGKSSLASNGAAAPPRDYVCIHAHFYQPPRENPWLEAVEVQDSAYPFHDWNERITAECYAPNSASRILDDEGFIQRIVNNYSNISFNFGPTLLSWLEDRQPETYRAILEADRASRERFSGHGSAIAQAYNHMI